MTEKSFFDISRNMVRVTHFLRDKVLICSFIIFLTTIFLSPIRHTLEILKNEICNVIPFFAISLLLSAFLIASNSAEVIRYMFEKYAKLSFFLSPIIGTLVPFCSCSAFPIIITLIDSGVSIAPMMAFLISAPVMHLQVVWIAYAMLGKKITFAIWAFALLSGWITGMVFLLVKPFVESPLKCQPSQLSRTHKPLRLAIWRYKESRILFIRTFARQGFLIGKWAILTIMISKILSEIPYVAHLMKLSSETSITHSPMFIPIMILLAIPTYTTTISSIFVSSMFLHYGIPDYAIITYMLAGGMSCLSTMILFCSMFKIRIVIIFYSIAFIMALISGFLFYFF